MAGKRKINEGKRTKNQAALVAEMAEIQIARLDTDVNCAHGKPRASSCNNCRRRVMHHPNFQREVRKAQGQRRAFKRRRMELRYAD